MQTLDVGESGTITTAWYKANGDATEPDSILLTIHPPTGAPIVKTKGDMTQGATVDVWFYNQIVALDGLWRYDVEGVVAGATVRLPSGQFLVGVDGQAGPCEPWATWDEVAACNTADFSTLDSAQRESILDVASSIMFDLSGRRYTGICQKTRSLCVACAQCGWRWGGDIWNAWCSCEPFDSIDLGPNTHAVWNVTVDGAILDPSEYTLVNHRLLARLNDMMWPRGIDVSDPAAFAATWAQGRAIPPGGRKAVALFAAEMALSCLGKACQLPQRVSTLTREGTTYTLIDSMKMISEERTGIYLVDLWLTADKKGRKAKPALFAPGAHTTRAY